MLHRMKLRRLCVLGIGVCVVACLGALLWCVLAAGGWTLAKGLMAAGFLGAAPWLGLCGANGLLGVLVGARRPAGQSVTAPLPPTAIAVTVRNEDLGAVLPPLQRLLLALDEAGVAFAPWVLSDTTDPAIAAAEERAVAAFPLAGRLRYRRRTENAGFKAGNIMEFLDRHAGNAEFLLVLDADSQMTAPAVLRLVRTLQAEPHLAIVQHLTVGLPATAAFPRLFQFGMRAGMRSWARATAWWQGDEACYWGHNAALRIAPFRAHARLAPLPDGSTILSHDQIEAAQLAGAGWGVRLLADEDGSFEANPPALPEFLHRELRWLAGNFQYWPLLQRPGLRPMGRWQLIQAMLLFGSTPFYVVFLLGAALAAATDSVSPFPWRPALALTLGWVGVLYAPKWLAYAALLLSRMERARYGGTKRVLAGMAAETLFTLLLDPVTILAKTLATTRMAFGARAGWAPQNRGARGVRWVEALRLLWPQTLFGVAVFAAFGSAGWLAMLWAAPLAGGLLTAMPFCVLTAHPRFGAWLQQRGVAAVPEEVTRDDGRSMMRASVSSNQTGSRQNDAANL
ncbi:MAG: glucans biosynthesis glucosyltransferase MdoH [Acetobacteraceae bacterium]|nr:glucans biosynthesis glucosyltransferase MdoH [Acetobacteraceae bacterium]